MEFRESETVELKRSLSQLDEALKAICGFLNHVGGTVYFGVRNDGDVIGLESSDESLRKISQQISSRIKPEVISRIRELDVEGKTVIEVNIPKGNNKPYYLNGVAYIKTGSEKRIMPPEEIERIYMAKKEKLWDSEVCEGATLDDIDENTLSRFVQLAKVKRLSDIKTEDTREILRIIKLYDGNYLTNAAILLFGKTPTKYFPQAYMKIGRFISDTDIAGSNNIEGNIFQMLEEVMEVLHKKYLMAGYTYEGLYRKEVLEYPEEAIREAVINAFIHRDYTSNAHLQMRIYSDRIWLWNAGGLPSGITIDELSVIHNSNPRNPNLAEIMFRAGLIEAWGRGTLKIIEECKTADLDIPVFKEEQGGFSVYFYNAKVSDNKQVLSKRQKITVEYLQKNNSITNGEYCSLFDVSKATATRDLDALLKTGLIERKGTTGRGTAYVLKGSCP